MGFLESPRKKNIVNLKLSNFLLLLVFLVACTDQQVGKYIDGDDIIPPEPPIFSYFSIDGVDSDEDGVRDDVERWINEEFFDSNSRRAMKSKAYNYLKLINSKSSEEAAKFHEIYLKSESCFRYVYTPSTPGYDLEKSHQIFDKMLNNYWRKKHARQGLRHLPAGIYDFESSIVKGLSNCDFKLNNALGLYDYYLLNRKGPKDDIEQLKVLRDEILKK